MSTIVKAETGAAPKPLMSLTVCEVSGGGFVVQFYDRNYGAHEFKFACTTLAEALKYMKKQFEQKK